MTLITKAFLTASAMAMAANAVPTVTPMPLGTGCEHYPSNGFYLEVNQCTDAVTGEPCEAEGLSNNAQARGDSDQDEGFITIVPVEETPAVKLDCVVGSDGEPMLTADLAGGENGVSLGMYDVEGVDMLAWQSGPIDLPQVYEHEAESGDVSADTFLGQNNVTTWGVRYADKGPSEASYYAIRLLLDGELREGESEAFLKIAV